MIIAFCQPRRLQYTAWAPSLQPHRVTMNDTARDNRWMVHIAILGLQHPLSREGFVNTESKFCSSSCENNCIIYVRDEFKKRKETDRQTDKQTDRQTDREKERKKGGGEYFGEDFYFYFYTTITARVLRQDRNT